MKCSHRDQCAWDVVQLCHPQNPVPFQEPDHEEKAQAAFQSQRRHISEEVAGVECGHPGQVHLLLLPD